MATTPYSGYDPTTSTVVEPPGSVNPAANPISADDTLTLVQDGVFRKVTVGTLLAGVIGANGQAVTYSSLTENVTIAAAAYSDSVIQIPAGAVTMGVSSLVTVAPPSTATFDIGIAGATTKFGTGISTTLATSDAGTLGGPQYNASAVAVRITPNGTPGDATGRIRITIHYYTVTAPTS